jgi:tetratricopeptide (TPR) repeat protein
MLSRFSVIVVLLLVDLSFDAVPLKGVILANEVGGTPMAKVTVTAAAGIKRDWCVVVNDAQLESALPERVEDNSLTTIFHNEREREEIARCSRRPHSFKAVEPLNLGILDRDENRMNEARQVYEETLKICGELAQKDSETNLAYLTPTLNNLGIFDSDKNRMEETLATYRELAQKDPETYLPRVAATLNDLGKLDSDKNRMDEAWK